MINSVRFECTRLGSHQQGVLDQDKDGYYVMPVGGLNVFNSAGQFYVFEEAKSLFEDSSPLMRRVQRGVLRAEVGHPVMEPGMTENDFIRRVLTIRESNVCAFHKEIWLDFDSIKDKDGRPVIAIMSRVAPSGPHGQMLEKMFARGGENVCFSIRAFTTDRMVGGVMQRKLDTVVTFDYVNEPGIDFAEKFKAPALEAEVIDERRFTRGQMTDALYNPEVKGLATESTLLTARELFTSLGWTAQQNTRPGYYGWQN